MRAKRANAPRSISQYGGMNLHPNAIDMTGQRIGMLTMLRPIGRKHHAVDWLCRCDCGKERAYPRCNLVGRTSRLLASCGCAKFTVSKRNKCQACGKDFVARWRRRDNRYERACSMKCAARTRDFNGAKNPNWRNNSTIRNHGARVTAAYGKWRKAVIERDQVCVNCGGDKQLEADHIQPWAQYKESRFDVRNGQTLCKECHHRKSVVMFGVRARKRDANEFEIVQALRKAGVRVVIMDEPCDLLCQIHGMWMTLEVKDILKSGKPRLDKRQKTQAIFLAETGTPIVTTPEEALKALGLI